TRVGNFDERQWGISVSAVTASPYPNALYKPGFLPNIYFSCAARARAMSWQLLGSDWDEDSFSLEHGTLGRIGLSSTEDDG
uniref:hypothetical protein n=1 Tax=Mycolicibacterium phlei TaxID=1771 RepID=UPI0037CA3DC2